MACRWPPCECSGEGPFLPGAPRPSETSVFIWRACTLATACILLLPCPELLFLEYSPCFCCCCSCIEVVLWRIDFGALDLLPEAAFSDRAGGSPGPFSTPILGSPLASRGP